MLKISDLAARSDFDFSSVSISPARRIVSGPAGQVSLEPRVMQVLMLLLDARGAVVTRTQIFDECWGSMMVGDDSINRAIGRVRKVIEEVAPGSFEIETIPRTGYRLIERAHEAAASVGELEPTADPHRQATSIVGRRWVLGGGIAAAAAGLAFLLGRPSAPDPAEQLIEDSQTAMRAGTEEMQRRAVQLLERAVAVSPNKARAWGLLALTLARIDEHTLGVPVSPPSRITAAASRALQLDKGNADAQAALAMAVPYYGDWLAAERRFDAVLSRHPDHLHTRDSRDFLLGAVGRMRESSLDRLAYPQAGSLEPGFQHRAVYALWFLGRIAEADRLANRGLEMWPRHPGLWFGRLWVLADSGRLDRALVHVEDEAGRPKLPPQMVATLGAGIKAAETRNPTDIDVAADRVLTGVSRSVAAVVNAMMLLNLMGATDRAFDLAQAYYLERGPIIPAVQWRPGQPAVPDQRRRKTNMLFTPTAAAMRRDPRFMPLVAEMGLVDYWKRRGVVPDFVASR